MSARVSRHWLVRWADGCVAGMQVSSLYRKLNAPTEATLAIQGCRTNSSSISSVPESEVTCQTMGFILSASSWRAKDGPRQV